MAQITLSLFGAMREYEKDSPLVFDIKSGANRDELRNEIARFLEISNTNIFDTCALATDDEIIGSDFCVTKDIKIAILPPVCGG